MSRFHLTLAALAVVQVVAILIVGGDADSVTRGAADEGFRPMPDIAAADLGSITIENGDGERVHVTRSEDGWVLKDRGGYPVRASQVEATATALRKLYAVRKLTDDPSRHFGLEVSPDKFHLRVTIADKDGEPVDDFYVGEKGGPGSLVYRPVAGETAWAATGPDSWDLEPSTSAWIETRYIDLNKDDVVKVEFLRASDSLVLLSKAIDEAPAKEAKDGAPTAEPDTTTAWYALVDGKETKADPTKVSTLLGSLTSLYMGEPIGKEQKPEYGFAQPTVTAKLTMKDGTTHTMLVGSKRGGDANDWYFKASTSAFVVTMRDYSVTDYFQKKVADLLPDPPKPEEGPKPGGK